MFGEPWIVSFTFYLSRVVSKSNWRRCQGISKRRKIDALKKQYKDGKTSLLEKSGSVGGGDCIRQPASKVQKHIRNYFPHKSSVSAEHPSVSIRKKIILGYVQCDIEVLENSRTNIVYFPPIFSNASASKFDIGSLMKNYAEEEELLSQSSKKLISSFTLQNGLLITPFVLFFLIGSNLYKKNHRFVQCTPKQFSKRCK